jgi:hypothetical protein
MVHYPLETCHDCGWNMKPNGLTKCHTPEKCFCKEFLFVAKVAIIHLKSNKKWRSSLGRFSKCWLWTTNKLQIFSHPSIFLATQWKPHIPIWLFLPLFSSLLVTEKFLKSFYFLKFNFTFWRYKKKARPEWTSIDQCTIYLLVVFESHC